MSRKSRKKRSKKSGLPPGTLMHIGEERTTKVRISIIDYGENFFEEKTAKTVEECCQYKDKPTTTWINVDGIHEVDVVEKIGKEFDLHPLLLEDILNTEQRPKMEDYEDYLFIVLKMISYDGQNRVVKSEQISLVLGKGYVISFQETEGDVFDVVRDRLRAGKGRVRKMGPDYLAYSLMDSIVDNYFGALEQMGEVIEMLEDKLVAEPSKETLQDIHKIKREMLFLRKAVWPMRELINAMQREEGGLIKPTTAIFLRDVYDHVIQVIDNIETYREMIAGMLDIYLSSLSNKMNEVMKVLTIIATIFIPLTFVAGVYGMNFKYMPELYWHWGYPFAWLLMLAISVVMVIYFRKNKWL